MSFDWEGVKKHLASTAFPEHLFTDKTKTDHGFSQHMDEKQGHELISYVAWSNKSRELEYEWRLAYCPQCYKIIHKFGTALNKVESLAYTRWFVRNGKAVNTAPRVQEPLHEIFDGSVPTLLGDILKGGVSA